MKKNELAYNSFIFLIGNIGTKFILFFLVPLHTSVLSAIEYGNADLINSTVSLLFPICTFGFCESIMRFTISKRENSKGILINGFCITILGTILSCIVSLFLWCIGFLREYTFYIPIIFFINAIHRMLQQYSKGIEKNIWFAADGILCALLQVLFSLLFLVEFKLGVDGYILSLIFSYFISSCVLLIVCKVINTLHKGDINKNEMKAARKYGIPLMSEEVSWWVIQASDRYMVAWICGAAVNGVYTVAYKIPALFNVLVTVFIQAFSISAFKDFDHKKMTGNKIDATDFNSIYRFYIAATYAAAGIIILFTKPIAFLILKNEFYSSWVYTPMLLCAFAIGNLQNYYGALFKGLKRSKDILMSTLIAAIANVILNYVLIGWVGAMGASVASLISYIIVYIYRVIDIKKYVIMEHYTIRCFLSSMLLIIMSVSYIQSTTMLNIISVLLFFFIVFLNGKELVEMLKKSISKGRHFFRS